MTLPFLGATPEAQQARDIFNQQLLRREIDILGWRTDGTDLKLRFRAPYNVPWVQVHIQSSVTGGLSYNAAVFISSTLVDCRATRVQDVTISAPSSILRYAIFLIPVQYDGAGTKILYDGQSGRPDNMSAVSDPRPTLPGPHVLATTSALGAEHTVSGLTARQVLIATGATTALFRALTALDVAGASDAERTFASSSLYTFSGALTVGGLGTFNAGLVVSGGSPVTGLLITGAAGTNRNVVGQTAGVNRWLLRLGDSTAETGSNAGSAAVLTARADDGTNIDDAWTVVRAAGGLMTIARPVTVSGLLTASAGVATDDPGSGVGTWHLGTKQTVVGPLVLSTTDYVELKIGSTAYKLALVT